MERSENTLTEKTETDFYLDLLVLSWRSSSSEEICLPRPPVGFCCRKLSRDTLAVEWDPRSESSRLLPALCARDQEHSPHNSRRPPQATAQATCGPVTPYQHVMGERRCGSPRGPGPTPDGPGAISGQIPPYRRALSQFFLEEQVDLAFLDSRQSRASCNNVAAASRRWEVSGKVSRQATARQDNKKRPW